MNHTRFCIVRPDLIEQNLSVPIGKEFYIGKKPLMYRWLPEKDEKDEIFQVFFNWSWQAAMSIDFEFDF